MDLKRLKAVTDNPQFLQFYTEGMSLLYRSGIFNVLREIAQPAAVSPESPNYVDHQAAVANISIGYNQALDHLLYFREKFVDSLSDTQNIHPDFGSLDAAVKKGDLTEEEADAIRAAR